MVTEIRIYYEGDEALQPGFRKFFSRVVENGKCKLRFISTAAAWRQDFSLAIESNPDSRNILLIDSEGPAYSAIETCKQNGWDAAHAASIFWMVEIMESWFHADKGALESYYGTGFNKNALKANPQVEQIPKKDLEDGLKAATRNTLKGKYHKTAHAPKLLERIDPKLVRKAAPNCDKLFVALEKELA